MATVEQRDDGDGGPDAVGGEPDPRRWYALTVLALAQVLLVLDSTVVNVALPSIQDAFGISDARLAWVVNGYALAFGGLLLLGGRLADVYGRRRMFLLGIAVFSSASFVAGIAWDADVVVAMRFLQGAAAAMVAPAALASISRIFTEPRERARALGTWGGLSALGGTLGVVLSGVLVAYASWRWVFLINVPVALIALVLAPRFVPESRAPAATSRLDVVGAVLVTAGIGTAVFALLEKGEKAYSDPAFLGTLMVGAVLLALFVWWESRVDSPIVPLSIFANRNRAVGIGAAIVFGMAFTTYFFSTTIYMQTVLGYAPLKTGFAYLPFGLTVLVAFPLVTTFVTRVGLRIIMTSGLVSAVAGLVVLSTIRPDGSYVRDVLPGMLLLALGASCGFVTFTIAGVDGTTNENAGIASGIINAGSQIGGALGLATLVSIAVSVQTSELASGADPASAAVDGFATSYRVAAVVLAVAALVTATVLRNPVREPASR